MVGSGAFLVGVVIHPDTYTVSPVMMTHTEETGHGPDDATLVARMARGDQAALGLLYDLHAPRLRAVALRVLGNHTEAEDIVQDVFMEAWRSAGSYDRQKASVRTWLVVRLRSRCIDRIRAAKVRRDAPEDRPPRPQPIGAPERMLARADASRLSESLRSLPDAQREVLVLLYAQGLSSSEAASQLGVPVGTVKSRVRLAMKQLRQTFAPEEAR